MEEHGMASYPRMKTCKGCRETIHSDANKCPKCQSYQVWWRNPQYVGLFIAPLFFLPIFFLPFSPFRAKPKFENFRSQIIVTESQMSFSKEGGRPEIVTLVKVRNNSPHKWEHPTVEVQYFSADGKLIDTQSASEYSITLVPNSEQAIRLTARAVRPETEYVSQKVFIRNADTPIFSE